MQGKQAIFLTAAGAVGLLAQHGSAGFQERFLQKIASSGKAELRDGLAGPCSGFANASLRK